jgi:hypothetical protein
MASSSLTNARVVPCDDGEWGILIDYGDGTWCKYSVGSRKEANNELARLIFDASKSGRRQMWRYV